MKLERMIGKTLGELAGQTGVFYHPVHIFLLKGASDSTGTFLMTAYSMQQVIDMHPAVASATIISANEITRETVLRIQVEEDKTNE